MIGKSTSLSSLTIAVFALLSSATAQAANGTWNSTTAGANAFWTNSLNWSASPYPSGSDIATFNNSGNGQTTLDVTGLASISGITFDTASAAPYNIGSNGVNQQTLVLANNGNIQLTSSATNNQRFDAGVTLGTDKNTGTCTFRNDQPSNTLTFAGNVAGSSSGVTAGVKNLNIEGSGNTLLLGNVTPGGASSLTLNANGNGNVTLSGTNTLLALYMNGTNSVIDIGSGQTTFTDAGAYNLVSSQNCTINGTGALVLSTAGGENYADNGAANGTTLTINCRLTGNTGFEYWHSTYTGTILLYGINDFNSNVIFNVAGTIGCAKVGNKGSTTSNLGKGTSIIFGTANNGRLLYTGTGETSDRLIELRNNAILETSGSGNLNFSSPIIVNSGAKTLTLQGSSAGTGEFSGPIRNDAGTVSLTKAGTGTWYLSSTNTYTGATAINGGTLALYGANGTASASSGYVITNGATLLLNNTAAANNTNRLSDTSAITLNGGTLSFSNDSSAASFSENVGAVTLNLGASTIATAQAAAGQTATLRLASLTRPAGTTALNFIGVGLGDSDRNRIFIAGIADGTLGAWATVNGTNAAAYSSTRGIYGTAITATDIAARGPSSVIPDDASTAVRINLDGTSGPITLAGDWTNRVLSVLQNTATDATVATRNGATNKTLLASAIQIGSGQASLTVGQAAGDGQLAALMPGGDLTLRNDNPAVRLTVNASITNNITASTLTKLGTGTVKLAGQNSYSGNTLIDDGLLIVSSSSTQTLAGAISGNGALTKEGSGLLALSGANAYTGMTVVSEGTLLVQNNTALGSAASGTVVSNGATLDVGGTLANNSLTVGLEPITVGGAGVNGVGAIINSSTGDQYNAISKLTLSGPTTFGGNSRWDLRNNTPTLAMNGFNVTKIGSNYVGLTGVAVTPGAGNIDIQQGIFTIEAGTTMGGSAANSFTVQNGATFDIYALIAPVAWSLVMNENSRFYARAGSVTNQNILAGPVTLNGRSVFDGVNPTIATFSGAITGTGSVVKTGAGVTTYFTSSNNTYSGATTISNGTLWTYYAGSLPGYGTSGKITVVGGGNLTVRTGDGTTGWSKAQIDALRTNAAFTANTATLGIDTTLGDLLFDLNLPQALSLSKEGNNTLTLSGVNTFSGTARVNGGTLTFPSSSSNAIGAITIAGGASGATLKLSGATTQLGSTTLFGGTVAGDRSMLYISTNVNIYCYNLSTVSGGNSAVYQSDGLNACSYWLGIGAVTAGSYAYYRMTGGSLTIATYFEVGVYGHGVMEVYGGNVTPGSGSTFVLDRRTGVSSVLNVFGGLVNAPAGGNGIQMGASDFAGPNARLNVIGPGVVNAAYGTSTTKMFEMNGGNGNGGTSVINLNNGGTLIANKIGATRSGITLVDFNGGTLRSSTNSTVGATFLQGLAGAIVYPGGAVIDTTNTSVQINQSLLAPTGYGVTAIGLRSNGAGYIGAPAVNITGGSGTGATAIATVDLTDGSPTKGQMTGITVTSPGFNYLSGDNLTVTFVGGGATNAAVTNACSLALNSSAGGLLKLGSGSLTLGGTNTYGGTTTISNGTVRLGVANALPTNAAVLVAGGAYDLNGFTVTNGSITVSSGDVYGGRLACTGISKTGGSTATLGTVLSATPVVVNGGVLRLTGDMPGIYEGSLPASFDIITANPKQATPLSPRYANIAYANSAASGGIWPDNTTYVYTGYIWNRTGTNAVWTFAEQFDDNVYVTIDGSLVLSNMTWNVPSTANVTLTPGAHQLEARFGQGGGGVGPNVNSWWTSTTMGFAYDPLGRNQGVQANYQPVIDPGDGSLLTLTATSGSGTNLIAAATSVTVASGATLDLGGTVRTIASLSGSGTVSNGTLAVTGTIAPGGTNVIGTLTLAASATPTGTLLVDVASNGTCDLLAVRGNVNLSALSLVIANPSQLDHHMQYTIATCTGTRTGSFSSVTVPNSRWHVVYLADGTVKLVFVDGTLLRLQ